MTYVRTCTFCGETKPGANYEGKFYCNKHWQRMYYHGTPYLKERVGKNLFINKGDYYEVVTSNGEIILIDSDDFEKVKRYTWCIGKTGYPVANTGKKVVKLHRYILNLSDSKDIRDHINGNPLDNRKSNLRKCTVADNNKNCKLSKNSKTGYTGVLLTRSGKYRARIMVNRKEIGLGIYETMEEAIFARRKAEEKYYGDYAPYKNIDYFSKYMNKPEVE